MVLKVRWILSKVINTENHLQKKGCLHKRTPTIHKIKNIADYVTKKWQDRDSQSTNNKAHSYGIEYFIRKILFLSILSPTSKQTKLL
jgi:uncharacterized protein YjgD (DUF1641 family)